LSCCSLPQAETEYERNNLKIYNMGNVVRMCERAVEERWKGYDVIFESEVKTASSKFFANMYRRGHMVRSHGRAPDDSLFKLLCCCAFDTSSASVVWEHPRGHHF
jgi:hypothetical protein